VYFPFPDHFFGITNKSFIFLISAVLYNKETSLFLLGDYGKAGYFFLFMAPKNQSGFWWCGKGPSKQQVTFSLSFSFINWFIY